MNDNNSVFSTRLKEALYLNNMKAADLCEATGRGKSAISQYLSGSFKPKQERLGQIARALHVSVAYLMGWDDPSIKISDGSHCFPIIGEVAAGYGSLAFEETGDQVAIPNEWLHGQNPESFFILRAKGSSMEPYIMNGDLLLVHRQSSVDPNSIAVVLYESELATVKKVNYVYGEDWVDLIPLNRDFEIKHINTRLGLSSCRILGLVWKMIREFEK